ncbi:PREDICTED: group XV phospholipase A2-like [Priapulus caudatus]|uniref:Group XV phospholipase A2-like n=1 Tax=Priapulus caudatus TaxID=37621 RepID=A0ABM1DNA6_PRICU|nr:PREDICTED: group XV phospholipase A2-like [Priapulus caudatus]
MERVGCCVFSVLVCYVILSSAEAKSIPIKHGIGHPVILIPGDGGSQVEAKLNKTVVPHSYCDKITSDYFNLWLNLELLIPYVLDCWVDNMRLDYDNVTRKASEPEGVNIRIPGFGNTTTVEWLDPSQASPGLYFTKIVDALIALGYTRGLNIKGAPYDFRRAPNEHGEYFKRLKTLVEQTYYSNGNHKVVLLCHSMGNPMVLYFLNGQSQAWKDKFVHSMFALAGVWGGTVKPIRVYASGENLGVFLLNPLTLRKQQRSTPSLAFLLPSSDFWGPDEVLATTAQRNYTVKDYKAFFDDLGYPNGYDSWLDTRDLIDIGKPPGVVVHCLHGAKVDTAERFAWKAGKFPDHQPTATYGDGDGTVNMRSLRGCLRWERAQKQKVYERGYKGVDHMGILQHPPIIDYLQKVLFS